MPDKLVGFLQAFCMPYTALSAEPEVILTVNSVSSHRGTDLHQENSGLIWSF